MSNRYDADHPARAGRNRDYGRRDDRYGGRRDEEESHSEARAGSGEDRRWGEGPFPDYRSDNRYRGRGWEGSEDRNEYRNPDYRGSGYSNPEHRSSDYYNAEQRNRFRPDERHWSGSSYSREYWDSDRVRSQGYARGPGREQGWSHEPQMGNIYGQEYGAHWPAAGAGSEAYHRPVRWRSELELGSRGGSYHTDSRGQAGKGPKGYVRSDERIREDVCDRLSDDDELDASEITVTVSGGEVKLEGTVADRHSKHRAEDLIESVSGVRDVTNNLRTRKGFLQELGDKISGDDKAEHRGHSGAGPQNSPNAPRTGGFSANR